MALLIVGLAGAFGTMAAAAAVGAPLWLVLAAYPLGGALGICAAALPLREAEEMEPPAALGRY